MLEIVTTKKDFKFEKQKDGSWKDLTTGLIWHHVKNHKPMNWYQTMDQFKEGPLRLATVDEFIEAEQHGFREVLGITSGWFWSSSVYPYGTDDAYGFSGGNGSVYFVVRSDYVGFSAVLCVGR